MSDGDRTTRPRARTPGAEDQTSVAGHLRVTDPDSERERRDYEGMHEAYAGSKLELDNFSGRLRLKGQPSSRTGENPPYE